MKQGFNRYLYRNYRLYSRVRWSASRRVTKMGALTFVGAFLLGLRMDTQLTIGYQAFCLLACCLVMSMILALGVRARFKAYRILPRLATAGQPMPYRIILTNDTPRSQRNWTVVDNPADPRPTLEQFISHPEPGEEKRNFFDRRYKFYRWKWLMKLNTIGQTEPVEAPLIGPRSSADLDMVFLAQRRGVARLKSITVLVPEPMGFINRIYTVPIEQAVLVLPKRYQIPRLELPGAMKYQPGGVAMASNVGASEEFVSLRDYRPGDPLKHIHWKSWARMNKPIVKEFEDEFFVRHALVLDTFTVDDGGVVFEEAVSVAASFACEIQTQESLLDLLFVGLQAYCFTSGRSLSHTEQMLEVLASVRACPDKSFDALRCLVVEHSALVSGCLCIFLAWDEPRHKLVESLIAMEVPINVIVIVPENSSKDLDPGPMRSAPASFHVLRAGEIQEGLNQL
jgi:hypothetical protein